MKKSLLTLALVAGFSLSAGAHQVWLEREGSVAKVYYGHWSHDFMEKRSGKRLGEIKGKEVLPQGALQKSEPLEDGIELKLGKVKDIALIEALDPRKGKMVETIIRTTFLARHGRSETKALMELDLVPQSAEGNTFTLLFRDKPLARTKVTIYAPHKWSKSLMSDDEGKVTIQTPWKGMYLMEASYMDEAKGVVNGKEYEKSNYVMTLVFVNESGIAWAEPAK